MRDQDRRQRQLQWWHRLLVGHGFHGRFRKRERAPTDGQFRAGVGRHSSSAFRYPGRYFSFQTRRDILRNLHPAKRWRGGSPRRRSSCESQTRVVRLWYENAGRSSPFHQCQQFSASSRCSSWEVPTSNAFERKTLVRIVLSLRATLKIFTATFGSTSVDALGNRVRHHAALLDMVS